MHPNISPGVYPSARMIAVSRVRSRTDIEMAFADTSRIVNVTAPQITPRYSFKFPKNARNVRTNSFSDSVRVGYGRVRKLRVNRPRNLRHVLHIVRTHNVRADQVTIIRKVLQQLPQILLVKKTPVPHSWDA